MSEWVFSVFSAVIIVAIITVLLPDGRLSKFVKPFISLIVVMIKHQVRIHHTGIVPLKKT